MQAVIKTGGKQYLVKPGDKIKLEKIEGKEGDEIVFDQILLLVGDKKEVDVGAPLIKGSKVKGKIIEQGRDKKVTVLKYKSKKRYQKKKGYRQPFTKVEIVEIS